VVRRSRPRLPARPPPASRSLRAFAVELEEVVLRLLGDLSQTKSPARTTSGMTISAASVMPRATATVFRAFMDRSSVRCVDVGMDARSG
jgi:hypothetical protein